jgi:peroxiredoxin
MNKSKIFFYITCFFIRLYDIQTSFFKLFVILVCLSYIHKSHSLDAISHPDSSNITNKLQNNFFIMQSMRNPSLESGLNFLDAQGEVITLKSLRNNVTVLYFFATWCSSCQIDLKNLDKITSQIKFLDIGDIKIVPVSIDYKEPKNIEKMFNKLGITNLSFVIDDNKRNMNALEVKSLPTTVIIDKDGRIISNIEQPIPWEKSEIANDLIALTKIPPSQHHTTIPNSLFKEKEMVFDNTQHKNVTLIK